MPMQFCIRYLIKVFSKCEYACAIVSFHFCPLMPHCICCIEHTFAGHQPLFLLFLMFCLFIKETVMEWTRHNKTKVVFLSEKQKLSFIVQIFLSLNVHQCFVFLLILKWFYFHNNSSYFVKSAFHFYATSPENLVKFSTFFFL